MEFRLKRTAVLAALLGSFAAADVSAQATGFATQNGGTTGGAGGNVVYATTGTQIHQALCNRASSSTPIIIHVEGTINHGNTSKVSGSSCNTADGVIELKEISNVSLIGVGNGALFDQLGIHIRSSSNIILQNLHVRNVKKSGSPTSNGGDAIGMESNVSNVWADHLTLEASGGESEGYDALFDMKADTKYVTLSYSILRNSGRGGLVGSSDSDLNNGPVTFHNNLYQNIDSRTPLLRGATAHAYNNHYVSINSSGMNPRIGGKIRAENNYFEDSKDPLGTFYTNDMGSWQVSGNVWSNIQWTSEGDKNHPAGPNPTSTTSISIPYSYSLCDANLVPQIVASTAGANKGLARATNCSGGSSSGGSSSSSSSSSSGGSGSGSSGGGGDLGTNLALAGGADGSSKASGSSYGNAIDGDTSSYWQPASSSGERISVKNLSGTFNTVVIREIGNRVQSWRLVNHDTGAELASGTTVGSALQVYLGDVSMSKINLMIDSASGAPQIAEFEIYNATGSSSSSSGGSSGGSASVTLNVSVSGSNANLNWNVSNIDVRNQEVYRDTDPDPAGRLRIASGVTGNSYTDSGLADGIYYYWIKVTDQNLATYNSNGDDAQIGSATATITLQENASGFCGVDGAVESEHSGFTGAGYANTDNASGAGVDWSVTVPAAGNYSLKWRYANGGSDRPAAVLVNGGNQALLSMGSTGAWSSYSDSSAVTVWLNGGTNSIRLQATGSSGLGNIDSMSITGAASAAANCSGS
ncbi:CBM35 domain-containing protein [Microbulbifer sp. SH-1]|uniref:pectate lyase family protein n=1 Tax=Microbulbifer sp. SH-1 TaxID=2681547 RepID=UPI00140C46F6|nr:CBM35 domain-containing protein [Microbulbifer sp. SH-1]